MSMLLEILAAALLIGAFAALRLKLASRADRERPTGCGLRPCSNDCERVRPKALARANHQV